MLSHAGAAMGVVARPDSTGTEVDLDRWREPPFDGQSTDAAIWWIGHLMGSADRAAGGRPSPERARCTGWLRQAVQTLANDPEQVRLACVFDWWFIARVGGQVSSDGWAIDHRLPAHLGTPLRRVLDAQNGSRPPIQVLRAPIRFQAALEVMERMTDRDQLPNLRKTPGPALLGEAIQEAQRLVEAGRRGDAMRAHPLA
jgi:hypothetical protein